MEKSKKILLLSNILLIGFFIQLAFVYYYSGILNLGYPYSSFLFNPNIAFSDFWGLLFHIKDLHPYALPANWQNYFPLSFILILPFAFIKNVFFAYLIFATGFLSFFTYCNFKKFSCPEFSNLQNIQNVIILTFVSYPVISLIDRGNLDMLGFAFFVPFIYFLKKEKYIRSAIFLAIINALKPFSFLFLVLFLFKKRYKEFFLSIGVTVLLIFGGFLFFGRDVYSQMVVLVKSWQYFVANYVASVDMSLSNQSSLFVMLKLFFCKLSIPFYLSIPALIKIYNIFSIFITGLTAIFAYREKTFWKQIMLLTIYMLLMPVVTMDYKLIFLYVPIWMFMNKAEKSKSDLAYVILLGLLFIPKHTVTALIGADWYSISVILNPLIMITIVGLILWEQFYKKSEEKQKQ